MILRRCQIFGKYFVAEAAAAVVHTLCTIPFILYSTVMYCSELYCAASLYSTVVYCTVLYCDAL